MTFTYFKKTGEIHFDHNGFDDYDGDDGYEFNYEVDDIDVHMALAEFIYEDFIVPVLSDKTQIEVDTQVVIKSIWDFISDNDLFGTLSKNYFEQLHDYFEEEAMRGR